MCSTIDQTRLPGGFPYNELLPWRKFHGQSSFIRTPVFGSVLNIEESK
jgi:hypothetical protein